MLFVSEVVDAHAGAPLSDIELNAFSTVPPAVGNADDTGHDGVGYLGFDFDGTHPRGHAHHRAIFDIAVFGVVGVKHERAPFFTTHESFTVVEP